MQSLGAAKRTVLTRIARAGTWDGEGDQAPQYAGSSACQIRRIALPKTSPRTLVAFEGEKQPVQARHRIAATAAVVHALPWIKIMAGWYKQHTSELASLEAFAKCGRSDLVTSWLRVTRWTVDHESDELPEAMRTDAAALEEAGLVVTFAARCKKLLDQRTSMAEKREAKRAPVNSRELTSIHVNSRDHQDKTKQDKTRQDERENAREREIPADWKPTAEHAERATAKNLDLEREADSFRHHALSHARKATRWNAAFTTWLIKAKPGAAEETTEEFFTRRGIPRYVPRTA